MKEEEERKKRREESRKKKGGGEAKLREKITSKGNKTKSKLLSTNKNVTKMMENVTVKDEKEGEVNMQVQEKVVESMFSSSDLFAAEDSSWKCQHGKISDGRHEWYIGKLPTLRWNETSLSFT